MAQDRTEKIWSIIVLSGFQLKSTENVSINPREKKRVNQMGR